MDKIIKRDVYLDQLIERMGNGLVKIITGCQRSGKSFLLDNIFTDYLLSIGVKRENIISIKLDLNRDLKYRNPLLLSEYVRGIVEGKKEDYFIFIDEIQLSDIIDNPYYHSEKKITFYDALNDLNSLSNLDVYVTVSNSKMLSSDILTEFRGRGDEIRLYPLSFREFYSVQKESKNSAFEEYLLFGGFPSVLNYREEKSKKRFLENLLKETYLKDIIQRNNIKREDILFSLLEFLSSSIGSITNVEKITNTINSIEKNKITEKVYNTTIRKYLDYLLDSFLFNEAKRYDIRGKQYFEKNSKFYSIDLGLRNVILNMRQGEKTHEIENLIYNELLFRGYSVDVGVIESYSKDKENKTKRKTQEVDFVVNGSFSRCYIQVSLDISNAEKEKKELMPFSVINDNFKKVIIVRDNGRTRYDQNGICYMDLMNFLLGEEIL